LRNARRRRLRLRRDLWPHRPTQTGRESGDYHSSAGKNRKAGNSHNTMTSRARAAGVPHLASIKEDAGVTMTDVNVMQSAAIIPDSKHVSLRLLLVAMGPVKPRSAATLDFLVPLRLILWSTLLREALDLAERLGPTKME